MRKLSYFMIALFALAACTKGTGTLYQEKSDVYPAFCMRY